MFGTSEGKDIDRAFMAFLATVIVFAFVAGVVVVTLLRWASGHVGIVFH